MSTLTSPEAIAAGIGAIASIAAAALVFKLTSSSTRDGRSLDQQNLNLTTMRSAADSGRSFKTFALSELRDLNYYIDLARSGNPLSSSRVALSSRAESMYGTQMRSLPGPFQHVHMAYENSLGHMRRIDAILDDYASSGTLPTGSALADYLYALRSQIDGMEGLIAASEHEFSTRNQLPPSWNNVRRQGGLSH
ncbi:hypothetical protein [Streptomyces sp. NPDC050738]|uniref:hypothetical protein n=1 Tax=Streptomyces sp. NPDC050738 TaxID=3154744 RepID=UPI003433B305